MQKIALIVAGGSGSRMLTEIPKQFIEIGQKPILMHTIEAFYGYDATIQIVLVLPENQLLTWQDLIQKYFFMLPHQVVIGGATRIQSVKNGLSALSANAAALVAIHDGVRPFVSQKIIAQSFEVALQKGNAVASVPLKDSIRQLRSDKQSLALDRTQFRLVQTPQTFLLSIIQKAYQQADIENFTDDASVIEKAGYVIELIEGSYENIKITTPEDLWIAQSFIQQLQKM